MHSCKLCNRGAEHSIPKWYFWREGWSHLSILSSGIPGWHQQHGGSPERKLTRAKVASNQILPAFHCSFSRSVSFPLLFSFQILHRNQMGILHRNSLAATISKTCLQVRYVSGNRWLCSWKLTRFHLGLKFSIALSWQNALFVANTISALYTAFTLRSSPGEMWIFPQVQFK